MISWWELKNLEKEVKMPIGNGPDCYTGTNPEEDKAIKLTTAIEDWWNDLTPDQKLTIYCYENNIEII